MKKPLNGFARNRSDGRPAVELVVGHRGPGQLHPPPEAFEAYCFSRLPEISASYLEKHVDACESCRGQLNSHKLTRRLLKESILRSNTVNVAAFHHSEDPGPHSFGAGDLQAARDRLPVSSAIISRTLAALNRVDVGLPEIESIVSQDPATAAHLVKVANSALLNRGQLVRSVAQAILYIGFKTAKLHILALSIRPAFASPELRAIWNHSVEVAKLARQLATVSEAVPPEEACLAGLVHDIGHLLLAGLGPQYRAASGKLRRLGMTPIEAEWENCGASHALIGADLLEEWLFPDDIVEAVRHHHAPSLSDWALTSVLFLAECLSEAEEDAFDPIEYSLSLRRLNLPASQLDSLQISADADLDMLSFAA